jgi:hypothetical protein
MLSFAPPPALAPLDDEDEEDCPDAFASPLSPPEAAPPSPGRLTLGMPPPTDGNPTEALAPPAVGMPFAPDWPPCPALDPDCAPADPCVWPLESLPVAPPD